MAKATKKSKAAAGSPAAKKEAAESYKYGVKEVAEATGLKPSSVRVAFRKHNIEKAEGGVYGWNTKAEMEAVIAEAFPPKAEKAAKPKKAKKSKKAKSEDTHEE